MPNAGISIINITLDAGAMSQGSIEISDLSIAEDDLETFSFQNPYAEPICFFNGSKVEEIITGPMIISY